VNFEITQSKHLAFAGATAGQAVAPGRNLPIAPVIISMMTDTASCTSEIALIADPLAGKPTSQFDPALPMTRRSGTNAVLDDQNSNWL
jgi:hypothetical protein